MIASFGRGHWVKLPVREATDLMIDLVRVLGKIERHSQPALLSGLPGWLLSGLVKSSARFLESIDAAKRGWERYLPRSYKEAKKDQRQRAHSMSEKGA